MDGVIVLISCLEADDVGVIGQMLHDLHFTPHILDIDGRPELLFRNGFTRQDLPSLPVAAQVRNPKLPASQLLPEHILHRYFIPVAIGQHAPPRGSRWLLVGVVSVGVVSVGGVVMRVIIRKGIRLRLLGAGGSAAIPHAIVAKICANL